MGDWDVVETGTTTKKEDPWAVVETTKAPRALATTDDEWTPISSAPKQDDQWTPAPDTGTKLLFGNQERLVGAAQKMMEATKNALSNLTQPLTQPFQAAKTPAERFMAPAVGAAGFAKRPLTEPIPGMEKAGEFVKELQPQAELDAAAEKAGREGGLSVRNFPYGKFAKRVGTEAVAGLVPKTALDVIAYAMPAILKGTPVAEMPSAIKVMKAVEAPIETTATELRAVPTVSPVEQVASRIVRKYRGEPQKYTLTNLYQDTINRFHSIEKIAEMAKTGEIKIPPGEDPGLLARSYLGLTGKVNTVLEHKMFRMTPEGNIQFTGPGLKETVAPMSGNFVDLDTYLVARRARNYAQLGLETGIDTNAAEKAITLLEQKHPQIKNVSEVSVQQWNDGLLQYLEDSGRIGKAYRPALKEANDFYAPMQRVLEEDPANFSLKNRDIFNRVMSPIKARTGSEKKILSPLESMVKNAFTIMDAADRNRVARSVLSLRQKNPELAEILKVVKKPGKDTITAYFGGQPVHYKAPPEVVSAMKGLSEEQATLLSKVLGFPTRVLRAGATLTPEFALRNPIRDQWSAMINSKYGFRPGYDTIRGAFSALKADEAYFKWQASGGAQSFLVSMDRTASDLLWNPPKGYWSQFGEYVKNPLKILQDVSGGLETPTRVGLFKRASEKGASDIEAGFESREGTIDFARRGAKMRAVNSIYAFFNARLQGVDKTIRTFKENPVRATLAAAPLTAASIALHMVNRGDPEYKEIPQWQKDLFWLFKVKGTWVKIPKGDIGMLFGSSAEHVMDWMEDNDPGKMAAFAFETLQATSPVDFNKGGLLPNFVRPIVENLANYNYFLKRSIVSEGKQRLLPEYQFSQYDSETSKMIGKLLDVSPAKVSNLITGYTGGMGRLGMDIVDKAGQAVGALPKSPELPTSASDIPGLRGFVMRPPTGSSSQSVNDFYQNFETIEQTMQTLKKHPEDFTHVDSKHPEWVLYKSFKKTGEALAKFRQIRDGILNAENVDPEKKQVAIEKLNAQMTGLARSAMDQLHDFKKKQKAEK